MRLFKECLAVCFHNFRKWSVNYKLWIIGIILCILIHSYWCDMNIISTELGMKPSPWIYPFLYSQFYMKLIFTLPIILVFCDAPFIDSNQIFIIKRSGRIKWIIGQMLYIVLTSGFYYIFILAVSLIISIPSAQWDTEWGKVLTTISQSSIAQSSGTFYVGGSGLIIRFFTPFQAIFFTFLMSWLCGIILGFIIFFLNTVTHTKFIGISITSAISVFSLMVANGDLDFLIQYSPISWITLDKIDVGGLTSNPTFAYCLTVYLVTIVILTALILVFGRKQAVDTMK